MAYHVGSCRKVLFFLVQILKSVLFLIDTWISGDRSLELVLKFCIFGPYRGCALFLLIRFRGGAKRVVRVAAYGSYYENASFNCNKIAHECLGEQTKSG